MGKYKKCLNCGNDLGRGQYKFCSCTCSVSYNNRERTLSKETRDKISKSLSQKSANFDENKWNEKRAEHEIDYQIKKENNNKCINCGCNLSKNAYKFCSNKCRQGYEYKTYIDKWKNGEINGSRGKYSISSHIKHYLFEKYNSKCQLCGWSKMNIYTNKIPLEIHHIDGNYKNNKEENLQLICPSCHSLTETYKSHNKNGRKERSKYK